MGRLIPAGTGMEFYRRDQDPRGGHRAAGRRPSRAATRPSTWWSPSTSRRAPRSRRRSQPFAASKGRRPAGDDGPFVLRGTLRAGRPDAGRERSVLTALAAALPLGGPCPRCVVWEASAADARLLADAAGPSTASRSRSRAPTSQSSAHSRRAERRSAPSGRRPTRCPRTRTAPAWVLVRPRGGRPRRRRAGVRAEGARLRPAGPARRCARRPGAGAASGSRGCRALDVGARTSTSWSSARIGTADPGTSGAVRRAQGTRSAISTASGPRGRGTPCSSPGRRPDLALAVAAPGGMRSGPRRFRSRRTASAARGTAAPVPCEARAFLDARTGAALAWVDADGDIDAIETEGPSFASAVGIVPAADALALARGGTRPARCSRPARALVRPARGRGGRRRASATRSR